MYDPKSLKAEEFIDDTEIRETLEYAEKNKNNHELIEQILAKAAPKKTGRGVECSGLSHREASVLLACDDPKVIEKIYALAREIKEAFYGDRIVMFAPLYLSNYCVNNCVYCPYHFKNKEIPRKKLTQDEVRDEVIALQDMGHKRLAIEAGEDPVNKGYRWQYHIYQHFLQPFLLSKPRFPNPFCLHQHIVREPHPNLLLKWYNKQENPLFFPKLEYHRKRHQPA